MEHSIKISSSAPYRVAIGKKTERVAVDFELENRAGRPFYDCCLTVTVGQQVVRCNIPEFIGKLSGIKLEFDPASFAGSDAVISGCLYHGDHILAVIRRMNSPAADISA